MVAAISNTPAFTSFNTAALVSTSSLLNSSSLSTSQQALLEAELAIYTQQLAEAQTAGSSAPGSLSVQQIQQQIAAIQQQLGQLSTSTSAPASSLTIGNLINIFV